MQGGEGIADHIQEIVEREHDADAITREVLQTVRRTFLTPFDRSAITSLITTMDDAIDEMQQTAGAVDLYDVAEFEPEMRDMAAIIVDAARLTAEAMPLLRKIRSEEHTSELQSLMRISYAVFCLKKKNQNKNDT